MKRTRIKSTVAAFGIICSAVALAGNCEIEVSRDACPGNEALSYKKCDGKKACVETVKAADAAACKQAAIAACEVFRPGITKSKSITSVKFDGTPLKPDGKDPDFCKAYPKRAAEYGKC